MTNSTIDEFASLDAGANMTNTGMEETVGRMKKFGDGYMKIATDNYNGRALSRKNLASAKDLTEYLKFRRISIFNSVERAIETCINMAMLNAEFYSAAVFPVSKMANSLGSDKGSADVKGNHRSNHSTGFREVGGAEL